VNNLLHDQVAAIDASQPIEDAIRYEIEAEVQATSLWEDVIRALPDKNDQLLAYEVFVEGIKPREVISIYPNKWKSTREVLIHLQRIRTVLSRDPKIRQWLLIE
jgi:hypothetical protein